MNTRSVFEPLFLSDVQRWLTEQADIFVMTRYAKSGGARDYFVIANYSDYRILLSSLPAMADVIVFRQRQLPVRGIANSDLLEKAITTIADGQSWIIVILSEQDHGKVLDIWDGQSHQEMVRIFHELTNTYIAVGEDPPFEGEDHPDMQSGIVPLADGSLQRGSAY